MLDLLRDIQRKTGIGIVLLLIPSVVMFLATSYILKNRLNLE